MHKERIVAGLPALVAEKKIHPAIADFSADFRRVVIDNLVHQVDYCGFILGGGAGFGDFNPDSSDLDIFFVIPNVRPQDRLIKVKKAAISFAQVTDLLASQGKIPGVGLRHLPSIFTEDEFEAYCCVFAAKMGLPISLGVFPTIVGKSYEDTNFVSSEQLRNDLAYSMWVFYTNIKTHTVGREDRDRYTYKRATYFLRFLTFLDNGQYIPSQKDLLEHVANKFPRWKNITPLLFSFLVTKQMPSSITEQEFVESILEAMSHDINNFEGESVLNQSSIEKGNVRTRILWTLEKTRWDYLQLSRQPEILRAVMTSSSKNWGFSFEQIDLLLSHAFRLLGQKDIKDDWESFKLKHLETLVQNEEVEYIQYYEEIYFPTIDQFLHRLLLPLQSLF